MSLCLAGAELHNHVLIYLGEMFLSNGGRAANPLTLLHGAQFVSYKKLT